MEEYRVVQVFIALVAAFLVYCGFVLWQHAHTILAVTSWIFGILLVEALRQSNK